MGTVHGGRLVARALRAEEVRFIFTLCGGHVMPIYDGGVEEGIGVIDVRHEQTAAHAADGWARVTGRPGVAVVTAGPGLTDAVTGVASAHRANIPMLIFGGQGPNAFIEAAVVDRHHVATAQGKDVRNVLRLQRFGNDAPAVNLSHLRVLDYRRAA